MSLILLFVIIFIANTTVEAKSKEMYVIPGGDSIGLQLSTGVYITGKYDVKTEKGDLSPWQKGDIETGDKIVEINNIAVKTIADIQLILSKMTNNQDVILKLKREQQFIVTVCEAVKTTTGKMSLGLYVKDEVLGVGTITYIDPANQSFGALGHSIINEEMKDQSIGYITSSTIKGIRKSLPGIPGEKQATLDKDIIGIITKNSNIGVFGKLEENNGLLFANKLKIANPTEVSLGKAEIWTVINDTKKEAFEIEIIEIKRQTTKDIKGIKIKITDARLLEKTGGIIQGMSGSPIIQNNMLIGAVSHVVVDTPNFGYGVYAKWMIENSGY